MFTVSIFYFQSLVPRLPRRLILAGQQVVLAGGSICGSLDLLVQGPVEVWWWEKGLQKSTRQFLEYYA